MQILAHDLGNPFNTLLVFSQLLLRDHKIYDDERMHYYLEIIDDTLVNTYEMLNSLLLWTKAQSGKINYETISFNLFELLETIHSQMIAIAQRKDIVLTVNAGYNEAVNTDKDMLTTVIRNLISNAIKFTNKGGKIEINSQLTDEDIIISVKDNGVGISPEQLNTLWSGALPHSTVGTDKEKGSGIGLFLCKDFVERMGGEISVVSQLGVGSTFTVRIPKGK